jgi:hypothetical protein
MRLDLNQQGEAQCKRSRANRFRATLFHIYPVLGVNDNKFRQKNAKKSQRPFRTESEKAKHKQPTTKNNITMSLTLPNQVEDALVVSPIDEFIGHIDAAIERRRQALEEDLRENVVVENKIVTERLAMVQGLQKHLDRARMARQMYEDQPAIDHNSHASISRADLHRRQYGNR